MYLHMYVRTHVCTYSQDNKLTLNRPAAHFRKALSCELSGYFQPVWGCGNALVEWCKVWVLTVSFAGVVTLRTPLSLHPYIHTHTRTYLLSVCAVIGWCYRDWVVTLPAEMLHAQAAWLMYCVSGGWGRRRDCERRCIDRFILWSEHIF